MQAPLNPSPDLTPDGFPIDAALRSQSRVAAKLYALLAVYYLAVTIMFLARMPWAGFEQVYQELSARSEAILVLVGFIAANVVLAACCWNVTSISRSAGWLLLVAALGATVWFWGVFALAAWRWVSSVTGPADLWLLASSVVQVLIYGACAYLIVHAVTIVNRQRTPV